MLDSLGESALKEQLSNKLSELEATRDDEELAEELKEAREQLDDCEDSDDYLELATKVKQIEEEYL